MKKLISKGLIILILVSVFLSGCGKEQVSETKVDDKVTEELGVEEESGGIDVEKNILTVDITLPQSMVGDLSDFNEQEYLSNNDGINSAKVNDDGSMTLNISKKKHKELLDEMKLELDETFHDLIESEDTPYIKKIEYTTNYREVKIIVNKEAYENSFDLTPLLVGMTTGMYQLYAGEEYHTKIIIEDIDTGIEIASVIYPDDLDWYSKVDTA